MSVQSVEKSRAIELLDSYALPYFQEQNKVYVEWKDRVVLINLDTSTWITEDHELGGDLDDLAGFLTEPRF